MYDSIITTTTPQLPESSGGKRMAHGLIPTAITHTQRLSDSESHSSQAGNMNVAFVLAESQISFVNDFDYQNEMTSHTVS